MNDEPAILRHFTFEHLPVHLQHVSEPFCALAHQLVEMPDCEERDVALRKLLEAKDAAVRAALTGGVSFGRNLAANLAAIDAAVAALSDRLDDLEKHAANTQGRT